MTAPTKLNEHTFATFVRPAVKFKAKPDTRKLIERVMPYFPKKCTCIAGYLDTEDQFWKINFHWELLVFMLDRALAVNPALGSTDKITEIRERMMTNAPVPQTGYRLSPTVGSPVDSSSHDRITERWAIMKKCKQDFREIIDAEKLDTKYPPAKKWDLSVAPVMKPGLSKHGAGYALDIEGEGMNATIKTISKGLGATLAYDEKSHVHVEFKHGVKSGL